MVTATAPAVILGIVTWVEVVACFAFTVAVFALAFWCFVCHRYSFSQAFRVLGLE